MLKFTESRPPSPEKSTAQKFAETMAVGLFLYVLTYFTVIKRAPGYIKCHGYFAVPAVRLSPYPENIRSKILILYRPLIFLDRKIRPEHWKWNGRGEKPGWTEF